MVYMQQTIDVSVSATVAALMENIHKIAQVGLEVNVNISVYVYSLICL